jgi:hypothetical protein
MERWVICGPDNNICRIEEKLDIQWNQMRVKCWRIRGDGVYAEQRLSVEK